MENHLESLVNLICKLESDYSDNALMHPQNIPVNKPKTIKNPAASFKEGLTCSGPSTNKAVVLNPFINPNIAIFTKGNQSD